MAEGGASKTAAATAERMGQRAKSKEKKGNLADNFKRTQHDYISV